MKTDKMLHGKGKGPRKRWTRDDTELFLLSLPTLLWYAIFAYLPMFGIIIAFKVYKLQPGGHGFIYNLLHSDWAGFSNFSFFFSSNAFTMLLKNTVLYNIAFIIISATVAVGGALMLSNMRNKGASKVYQTMMFLPYFMSWVVIAYFVYAILTPERGLFKRYFKIVRRRPDYVVPGGKVLAVYPCTAEYLERYGIRHGALSCEHYRHRPVDV
jgi:putative aldouronate transport system permease protein